MSKDGIIYLDHAATTPTNSGVLEAMLPYFSQRYGNPSSVYGVGTASSEAISRARATVADIIGADRKEIIFTSGASEAINLAIKGVALARRKAGLGAHIVTTAIEHHATLHAFEYLKELGFESTVLPVDEHGRVTADDVRAALRPETVIVSVMYANNEIGTILPVAEIGAVCRAQGVPFHIDAVQGVGSLPIDVEDLQCDLLSVSGHKFYGPKGTGVLYVRHDTSLLPQLNGGGQEAGRRGGTENVPGIVGLAVALELAVEQQSEYVAHCRRLRDRLRDGITEKIPRVKVNGHPTERLPNNLHLSFDFVEGDKTTESMLVHLDHLGICASTGSACNSRALEPSHVLKAIGLPPSSAHSSLRFTVGRQNDDAEIDRVLQVLPATVEKVRSVSPAYHRFLREGGACDGANAGTKKRIRHV